MYLILREPFVERQLRASGTVIVATPSSGLPSPFASLPLAIFAVLLHDLPLRFPAVAIDEVQKWGNRGSDYTLALGMSV